MDNSPVPGTFGFIDLAGFTALTEAHGDQEAVGLLDRFERLVDAALAGAGTRIKSIGDAVMLRFGDPASAVAGVARVFTGCADEPSFPLPRAGLHHGTAVPRDGDWFGATVNLAARSPGRPTAGSYWPPPRSPRPRAAQG
jgi:adenylate cyclase